MDENTNQYWVQYKVKGFSNGEIKGFEDEDTLLEAGPYETPAIAFEQSKDILGFEGVYDCAVVGKPKPNPSVEIPEKLTCSECGFTQPLDCRTGLWYSSALFRSGRVSSLYFQCCPEHARQADEAGAYAPVVLDGFECWDGDAGDHMVPAKEETPQAKLQGVLGIPATFGGLDNEIKKALETHRTDPLVWEKINETTERAWSDAFGGYITRPRIEASRRAVIKKTSRDFSQALSESMGDLPRKTLETFQNQMGLAMIRPRIAQILASRGDFSQIHAAVSQVFEEHLQSGYVESLSVAQDWDGSSASKGVRIDANIMFDHSCPEPEKFEMVFHDVVMLGDPGGEPWPSRS